MEYLRAAVDMIVENFSYESVFRMLRCGLNDKMCIRDMYRKYEEIHYQRAYDMEEVKNLLAKAGMEFVAVYDAFTHRPPRAVSERVYIIAREKGKRRKQEK